MAYEIFFDKNYVLDQISSMIASSMGLTMNDLLCIKGSLIDYIDENGSCSIAFRDDLDDNRILCEVFYLGGDFKTKVQLDFPEEIFSGSQFHLAKKIAMENKIQCLVGSDEINPYHWIYIDQEGNDKPVYVDRERLDSCNEFVFAEDA